MNPSLVFLFCVLCSVFSVVASASTALHSRGLRGEGQVIAVLDTGLDWDSCYFAEADGSAPPINTGSPGGGLEHANVDPSRRKVIAYNFLYSCDQYPTARACDDPRVPTAYDNNGHGTHAASAAAGDWAAPFVQDHGDGVAPAAKLVIQDAGLLASDNCTFRPGMGCPVRLTPILEQAWRQGVRIHSNSWGDRQGTPAPFTPPTANYSSSARDVDAFIWEHPEMLVVFNTGNWGSAEASPPASSLSSPGSAKNTLQTGGTHKFAQNDEVLASYTLFGPTRDGRIKPDVVMPAEVLGGDTDLDVRTRNCNTSTQQGTSWASPTLAGSAALVRQYYTEGFYPTGVRLAADALTPSAALLKATIIAATRPILWRAMPQGGDTPAAPPPSNEQGFGFPVLDDALYFEGDTSRMRVVDVPVASGLAEGQSTALRVSARAGTRLRAVLVWTDPPGTPRGTTDTTPQLVNDLDLRVIGPDRTHFGNEPLHPGSPDRLNNVEVVNIAQPASGTYTITVNATRLGSGPRQSYALVVVGDIVESPPRVRAVRR